MVIAGMLKNFTPGRDSDPFALTSRRCNTGRRRPDSPKAEFDQIESPAQPPPYPSPLLGEGISR